MRQLYKRYSSAGRVAAALGLVGSFGAGVALAATVTVTLGPSGPQPATVTVQWGDTVTFANGDSAAHSVEIPRLTVASPSIPPGGSWAQVFDGRQGNYAVRQTGERNFSGAVIVELTGKVTMTATPAHVVYGKRVSFQGTALPGFPVKVEQQIAGASAEWTESLTATAGADGAWSASLVPQIGTRYRASAAADQLRSPTVSVGVRPAVSLAGLRRAPTGRKLTLRTRIAPAKAAITADLERYDAARRRWVREDRRRVSPAGTVAFRWSVLKGRSRLRVQLLRIALRPGFEAATSKQLLITGT